MNYASAFPLSLLDINLAARLAQMLSVKDYLASRQICKEWKGVLDRDEVWAALCRKNWPQYPRVKGSWKLLGWSMINLMRGRLYDGGELMLTQHEPYLQLCGSYVVGYGCWRVGEDNSCAQIHYVEPKIIFKRYAGGGVVGPNCFGEDDSRRKLLVLVGHLRHIVQCLDIETQKVEWNHSIGGVGVDTRLELRAVIVGEKSVCWALARDNAYDDFELAVALDLRTGKKIDELSVGRSNLGRWMVFDVPGSAPLLRLGNSNRATWKTFSSTGWQTTDLAIACPVLSAANRDKDWDTLSQPFFFGGGIVVTPWKHMRTFSTECGAALRVVDPNAPDPSAAIRVLWRWDGCSIGSQWGFSKEQGAIVLVKYVGWTTTYRIFRTCPPMDNSIQPCLTNVNGKLVPNQQRSENNCQLQ